MPIYEFKCANCNRIFSELIRNVNNIADIHCPNCNNEKVSRIMSSFGFSTGSASTNSKSTNSCSSCTAKNCATCR